LRQLKDLSFLLRGDGPQGLLLEVGQFGFKIVSRFTLFEGATVTAIDGRYGVRAA
jgi:hypothetical protein